MFKHLPLSNKVLLGYYVFTYVCSVLLGPESLNYPIFKNIVTFGKTQHYKRFLFITNISMLLNIWYLLLPSHETYFNAIFANSIAAIYYFLIVKDIPIGNINHILNFLLVFIHGIKYLFVKKNPFNKITLLLVIYMVVLYIFRHKVYKLKK